MNSNLPEGLVAGSFLLGLQAAFKSVNSLPQGVDFGVELILPTEWYPYALFMDMIEAIEAAAPADSVMFEAGKQFLRIWYEQGPGKEILHSTEDWLFANQESGGYNTVVTGGTPEQIGWCKLLQIDMEAGFALYENVMPLKGEFLRGVFYGGCVLFDDLEYVDVEGECVPYGTNSKFHYSTIRVIFKLKNRDLSACLDKKVADFNSQPREFSSAEVEALLWRCRGLGARLRYEELYNREITSILAGAFTIVQNSIEELKGAKLKAEIANLAKSQFLATMSHEIRTPLNGILGMAQLLMDEQVKREDRETYTSVIYNSGNTLLTILNDILDLSKVEAGQVELEEIRLSPSQILHEIAVLFGEQAKAKGLDLETRISTLPSSFYKGDPNRIRQMLSNLLNNAIKFTRSGKIKLGLDSVEQEGKMMLEFSVTDSGIGIPAEKMGRLFKAFSQVDSSTTREFGGSGLGLSIVLKFAEMMGGCAGAESEFGVGSRFWFRVCLDMDGSDLQRVDAVPQLQGVESATLEGRLIWVAEDNRTNQILITTILKKFKMRFELFDNGLSLVEMLGLGFNPELILMDCLMPIMDGYEATRKIRSMEAQSGACSIPILALTASGFAEDARRCTEAGMDEVLTKPLNVERLREAMLKWLS